MAFSVISISSDSSEESMGMSTARVILFGTIPATIPLITPGTNLPIIHDDTLLTPTISPTIPTIPTDPYEDVVARWKSRVAARLSPPSSPICQMLPAPTGLPHRPAVLVLPGQSILVGRPYRSSSSNSSSKHSSSGHAILNSLDVSLTTASTRPSRMRCRSPTSYVRVVLPVRRALSLVRADLSPPPKRIRDSDLVTNLEVSSEDGYEPYVPREAELKGRMIKMWLRLRPQRRSGLERDTVEVEVDPRVGLVVKDDARESVREDVLDHVTSGGAVEVTYETLEDSIERFHDHAVEIPVH
nr:hypothetical protein [Tanacetum cinerariifolium]